MKFFISLDLIRGKDLFNRCHQLLRNQSYFESAHQLSLTISQNTHHCWQRHMCSIVICVPSYILCSSSSSTSITNLYLGTLQWSVDRRQDKWELSHRVITLLCSANSNNFEVSPPESSTIFMKKYWHQDFANLNMV